MDDKLDIVAEWLGLTTVQTNELKKRLDFLRNDETGFGSIKIDVKRKMVFRISHIVDGKPVVFRDEVST